MKAIKVFAIAFILAFSLPMVAQATQPDEDTGHKVTICHRTHSDTNPYVVITVDIAAAGYGSAKGDHFYQHQGPVWELGLKEQHIEWGDIIPPYEYEDDEFSFPGYNWDEKGIAIYENDCKPTTPPPTSPPPTSPPPTTTPPPTTPPPTTPPTSEPPKTDPPTHTNSKPPSSPTAFTGVGDTAWKLGGIAALLAIAGATIMRYTSRKKI